MKALRTTLGLWLLACMEAWATPPSGFGIEGTLKAVDPQKQAITVTATWQQDYAEPVTPKTRITLNCKPAALADLKPGMKVTMAVTTKGTRCVEWIAATLPPRPDAPTGAIAGTVVDEHGKALAGATVSLDSPPRADAPQKRMATVTTDLQGKFWIENVPPAEGYVIAGETKDHWGSRDRISVQAGRTVEVGQLSIAPGPRM